MFHFVAAICHSLSKKVKKKKKKLFKRLTMEVMYTVDFFFF